MVGRFSPMERQYKRYCLSRLVTACKEVWELRRRLETLYIPSALLEQDYESRVADDKKRFFNA